ncbi:hypothetical protein [Rhizobium tumorigenes]|uniref:hypothetical protein n=1 Tax=Rhizobium tumorigenes TaxID=2041385 RepID=UPI00241D40E5|nr:hypothetical protein [Rhizobium tumorigenes]WFS04192.1 hypothetical protein PR016_24225 [Rhizobium tumorigenes]
MVDEIKMQADDQADILEHIPHDSYENNPAAAFEIMSHVVAMTKMPSQVDRHQYGQEILRNLGANFYNSYNAPFKMRITTLVGPHQEIPNFNNYGALDMSTEDLVSRYILVRRTVFGMTVAGYGGGAGLMKRGGGAVKGATGAVTDSVKQLKLPDSSDIWAGAKKGAGPLPKSPVQALVWVVGYAAYSDLCKYKERLSTEIKRRWKNKMMSKDLYSKAFGSILHGADEFLPSEFRPPDESGNLELKQYEKPLTSSGELP